MPAPTLITPINGATNQLISPPLTWGAVAGATNYEVQISSDAGFAVPELDQQSIATSMDLGSLVGEVGYPLQFGTPYFWRVRALVGGAWDVWAAAFIFTTETVTLPVTPILDHVARGTALTLTRFRQLDAGSRFKQFLAALLTEVQLFENAIRDVMVSRMLRYARGAQLDLIGRVVDQPRTSLDDAVYRIAIMLKIFRNNSSATPGQLQYICQQLCASDSVKYIEIGPGSYRLQVFGGSIPTNILPSMQSVTSAGVRILGVHRTYPLRHFHMTDRINQALLHE